ncbi:hypothetical protein JQC67_00245 [Aurantibacter crassamenti]|uniref:hypothetical protein n=1 Tax=Aurantibacter crassamenti TaxID=1837375 RepID=UPI00193A42AE|nr:hypothetical protein [Aurantibacter crassamenti]MBM1104554.1 hypothetical protein [Aurantibacter crassamenti]
MNKKEIFWLVGTIVIVLVLILIFFGIDGFNINSTFDINIHDTYFVISNIHLIFLLSVSLFFTIYFIRTIRNRFKNMTVNLVLIIATILFTIALGKTITMLGFFSGPTINVSIVESENVVKNGLKVISQILFTVQIALLVLLAYFGFRTGRNYNSKKTKLNNT